MGTLVRPASGASSAGRVRDAIVTELLANGSMWVRFTDAAGEPYGDEVGVGCYLFYFESWDKADPPLNVGDHVLILQPAPFSGDWYLLWRVIGTCESAQDFGSLRSGRTAPPGKRR